MIRTGTANRKGTQRSARAVYRIWQRRGIMVRPEPREGLMKVYLETMGCQMNRLDSELVAGALRAAGHELVDSPARAEVLLYNTCSVRHHAEQKAHSRLAEQSRRKAASKRRMIIGVLGCMAQREGQALLERYSQLDIVCGPGQLQALAGLITNIADGLREQAAVLDQPRGLRTRCDEEPFDEMDLARDPALTTGPVQAFVRVSQGCDRFCAYCVVPYVRGMQLNRDPARIVEEVRRLVDAGRTEITLLGQTVNAYRWRSGTLTVRFANLLERVSGVAGLRRLRFITSHPADFGLEVLEAMAGLPNVCPYLHLPAQSGSDAVLKRMRRGYTRAQYDELVERAGTIVPGIVLAGDFIVGFPGETEEDHQASADLIRRSGYKNSFIFRYSPRPGTAAAEKLADDVPREVKRRRNSELLAVQAEVGLAHHRRYVGKTVEVLVEGPSPQAGKRKSAGPDTLQLVGRTVGNHIVVFDGRAELAGRYVQVEVVAATPLTLIGSLAASPQQRNRGVAGNEKG